MLSLILVFLSRCLLVALFLPFSALDKILNFAQATDQAKQATSRPWLAKAMIVAGCCLEVIMSAAILSGIADRLAALVLAGYCMVTALLWKRFWLQPNFRLRGTGSDRDLFWDFLKNLALAGGFLMLALGPNSAAIKQFASHPFASSHPYSKDASS